jgi:hypothetical protein
VGEVGWQGRKSKHTSLDTEQVSQHGEKARLKSEQDSLKSKQVRQDSEARK